MDGNLTKMFNFLRKNNDPRKEILKVVEDLSKKRLCDSVGTPKVVDEEFSVSAITTEKEYLIITVYLCPTMGFIKYKLQGKFDTQITNRFLCRYSLIQYIKKLYC